jgi:hypothetical protein
MATTLTMTRANSALKVLFPQKRIEMMDWENLAFYNWVTRDKGFYGRSCELPVRIGPSGNASNNFAAAQSMKGSSNYTHFIMTRVKKYIMASFDNEALEASENDAGAYMSFKELEIEGIITGIKQQTAADFQGNGSGRIATVSNVTGDVLTVGEADIVHFQLDQRIQSFASNVAGASPTSGGPKGWMTVGAIDPDTNKITLNLTDGDTALQDGVDSTTDKYLAIYGSVGNALSGTQAWVPGGTQAERTTALGTTFKNVLRSQFTSRLGGVYFDGTANGSIAEALERAIARGNKEGSRPEVAWLNHNRFQDLSLDLGARAVREPYKMGAFAYSSIKFAASGKDIRVLADPNFADNDCLIATKASWRFHTLKDAPRGLGRQGNGDMILEPAADGWEVRYGWYGELECLAPIDNIRCMLPT